MERWKTSTKDITNHQCLIGGIADHFALSSVIFQSVIQGSPSSFSLNRVNEEDPHTISSSHSQKPLDSQQHTDEIESPVQSIHSPWCVPRHISSSSYVQVRLIYSTQIVRIPHRLRRFCVISGLTIHPSLSEVLMECTRQLAIWSTLMELTASPSSYCSHCLFYCFCPYPLSPTSSSSIRRRGRWRWWRSWVDDLIDMSTDSNFQMGLSMTAYWVSTWVFSAILNIITATIVVIIGVSCKLPFFILPNVFSYIILLLLNCIAQPTFGMLCSVFFSQPRTAGIVMYLSSLSSVGFMFFNLMGEFWWFDHIISTSYHNTS